MSLSSVKSTLKEAELIFWSNHFKRALYNITSGSTAITSSTSTTWEYIVRLLPVAMVTKLELTDCVVNFDVDSHNLTPAKGPFGSLVLVGGVLKITRHLNNIETTCLLKDSYLHLSGLSHTPDDLEVLPSSSHHVWGRVIGLGSVTLNMMSSSSLRNVIIKGRGQTIIFELSELMLYTLSQLTEHFRGRYGNGSHNDITPINSTPPPHNKQWIDYLVSNMSLSVEGVNIIMYQDSPSELLLFFRTDSCSLQGKRLDCYKVAIDELYYLPLYFQCLSVSNLPNAGLLDIDHCFLQYNQVCNIYIFREIHALIVY